MERDTISERRREAQIEFPPLQTHNPMVTTVLLAASLICVAVVVIMLLAGLDGPFIGPWG
jgi:hypothetical protein